MTVGKHGSGPVRRPTSNRLGAYAALLGALLGCSGPQDGAAPALSTAELAALRDCTAATTVRVSNIPAFVGVLAHSWSYEPLALDALNGVIEATRALDADDLDA